MTSGDPRSSGHLYWSCGNKTFKNKWDLLSFSRQTNKAPVFHFFDESFSTYDWAKNPTLSWEELLRIRAEQLREKYDYIRLFYSGGVDSQTMLNTFIKNNIYLDEILVYRASAFTDKFDLDPAESEITSVAIPFLKSIEQLIPKTKFTILETTPKMLSSIVTESYFYEESTFAIRPWCESHLYKLHPKLYAPVEAGKFHCDLRGGDKPKVYLKDHNYYMAMYDSSRIWDIGDKYLENFYIGPDMPELHAKQCHIVVDYLEQRKIKNPKKFFDVFDLEKTETINKLCRHDRFREVNLGKGITGILSSKQVIVQNYAKKYNPKIYQKWSDFLNNEKRLCPERFNNNNILHDFKGILSNEYLLRRSRN
jgi:hypothetical protein